MKRLEWNVQYSVGVPRLDQQHAYLFELANRLARHIGNPESASVISDTVTELHRYVDEHFTYEEAVMKSAGYQALGEHQKMHELMRTRLALFTAQLKEGVLNRHDFIQFIEEWLTLHILGEDMKYIPSVSAMAGREVN